MADMNEIDSKSYWGPEVSLKRSAGVHGPCALITLCTMGSYWALKFLIGDEKKLHALA